jgi:pyocin large subunit-like protein
MNYGRVNNVVAYSPDLSLDAKGMYAIICSLCGSKTYCYPTVQTLTKMSGKSKSTTQRLLKELSEKSVILRNFDPVLLMTITHNLMDTKTKL